MSVPESQEYPLVWPGIGRACLGFPFALCVRNFNLFVLQSLNQEGTRGELGGLRTAGRELLRSTRSWTGLLPRRSIATRRLLWPRLYMPLPFRGLLATLSSVAVACAGYVYDSLAEGEWFYAQPKRRNRASPLRSCKQWRS